jgi:hypothetical protein
MAWPVAARFRFGMKRGSALPRRARRRDRDQSGLALIEFALVAPVLVLLVFGTIEFGFAFNNNLELRSASREGARLGAVNNGCTTDPICGTADAQRDQLIAATRSRAQGLAGPQEIRISVSRSGALVGTDSVVVCLNYTLRSQTGLFTPVLDNTVLRSKAVMRLEQRPTFSEGTDTGGPGPASC